MHKVLIAGVCGYIGKALYNHLQFQDFEVVGFDNHSREKNVAGVGSQSIVDFYYPKHTVLDATNYEPLKKFIKQEQPDTIVWLAEQPSAPFSMRSAQDATYTQQNNIVGTLNVLWAMREVAPHAHLIKLGTEGEYPDWLWNKKHVPEGNRLQVKHRNQRWVIPTPRYAGSWYHWSKVHDSMNIDYACKIWNLRVTDVNQGVVVGHLPGTRLDIDEYFGTVANRFAAQAAIGFPLTVYGQGEQTRGFIALEDSIEAIRLLTENSAREGEFRVIHQTAHEHSINEIARMVHQFTGARIERLKNPRAELENNEFTFDKTTLKSLGLKMRNIEDAVQQVCEATEANKKNIEKVKHLIHPKTTWR